MKRQQKKTSGKGQKFSAKFPKNAITYNVPLGEMIEAMLTRDGQLARAAARLTASPDNVFPLSPLAGVVVLNRIVPSDRNLYIPPIEIERGFAFFERDLPYHREVCIIPDADGIETLVMADNAADLRAALIRRINDSDEQFAHAMIGEFGPNIDIPERCIWYTSVGNLLETFRVVEYKGEAYFVRRTIDGPLEPKAFPHPGGPAMIRLDATVYFYAIPPKPGRSIEEIQIMGMTSPSGKQVPYVELTPDALRRAYHGVAQFAELPPDYLSRDGFVMASAPWEAVGPLYSEWTIERQFVSFQTMNLYRGNGPYLETIHATKAGDLKSVIKAAEERIKYHTEARS